MKLCRQCSDRQRVFVCDNLKEIECLDARNVHMLLITPRIGVMERLRDYLENLQRLSYTSSDFQYAYIFR